MNNSVFLLKTDCHPQSPLMECINNNDSKEFLKLLKGSVFNGTTLYSNIFL